MPNMELFGLGTIFDEYLQKYNKYRIRVPMAEAITSGMRPGYLPGELGSEDGMTVEDEMLEFHVRHGGRHGGFPTL
jgi:hypothetical protein